jgi:hypothetical protein
MVLPLNVVCNYNVRTSIIQFQWKRTKASAGGEAAYFADPLDAMVMQDWPFDCEHQ